MFSSCRSGRHFRAGHTSTVFAERQTVTRSLFPLETPGSSWIGWPKTIVCVCVTAARKKTGRPSVRKDLDALKKHAAQIVARPANSSTSDWLCQYKILHVSY